MEYADFCGRNKVASETRRRPVSQPTYGAGKKSQSGSDSRLGLIDKRLADFVAHQSRKAGFPQIQVDRAAWPCIQKKMIENDVTPVRKSGASATRSGVCLVRSSPEATDDT